MKFDIITLFPKMFESPFAESMIHHAQKNGKIEIVTHQLRDYAADKHHTTDDTPYGGGPGMVIKVDVVDKALTGVKRQTTNDKQRVVMLSASGEKFTQAKAIELAKYDNIILLCGHYEGFDYRVHEHLIDEEISIGDYVLTGGEIPAMVVVDTVSRMIPGVIKEESIINESFIDQDARNKIQETNKSQDANFKSQTVCHCEEHADLAGTKQSDPTTMKQLSNGTMSSFDYPVYTRPVQYKGWRVPEVLQNGNHQKIHEWREKQKGQANELA